MTKRGTEVLINLTAKMMVSKAYKNLMTFPGGALFVIALGNVSVKTQDFSYSFQISDSVLLYFFFFDWPGVTTISFSLTVPHMSLPVKKR